VLLGVSLTWHLQPDTWHLRFRIPSLMKKRLRPLNHLPCRSVVDRGNPFADEEAIETHSPHFRIR